MTTITRQQFIDLIKSAAITCDSEQVEINYGQDQPCDYEDVGDDIRKIYAPDMVWGWIFNTLTAPGIEVTYQNIYEHVVGKPSTAAISDDVPDDWQIEKLPTVLDEDGDEIDSDDLLDLILEHSNINQFDLPVLGSDEYLTIDNDEGSDMDEHIVERDNDSDIKFRGELIASESSSNNNASSYYSGSPGRWTTLALYRTAGGRYVCEQVGHTQWQGEHDRRSGAVCETVDEVIEFFGHGWLAKQLYAEAGIEDALIVE